MNTYRLLLAAKSMVPASRALSRSLRPVLESVNATKIFPSQTQTCKYSSSLLSRRVMYSPLVAAQRLSIRCRVTRSNNQQLSNSSNPHSQWGDRSPEETEAMFPGCDYQHWMVVMEAPSDRRTSKQEQIDFYIKTVAQVVGSEEAAKKAIYNVSFERYYGFGCEMDEESSNKLEGLPGVNFVLPDSYVDAENKDYGATLLVDGKIVERSPERQKRVTPPPQQNNSSRSRYNDRTRSARRRENQSQGMQREYRSPDMPPRENRSPDMMPPRENRSPDMMPPRENRSPDMMQRENPSPGR